MAIVGVSINREEARAAIEDQLRALNLLHRIVYTMHAGGDMQDGDYMLYVKAEKAMQKAGPALYRMLENIPTEGKVYTS
jgi:hypothetical protein